jgi:hypothetical protein
MNYRCLVCFLLITSSVAHAGERVLDARMHHLRSGKEREWSDFPEQAEGPKLTVRFGAEKNAAPQTLRWRQQDVKQAWRVILNGKLLAALTADENDQVLYQAIPPETLKSGANEIVIEAASKATDDIRVGDIALDDRPRETVLSEGKVEVSVADGDHADRPLPCRITVLNADGALMTVGAKSGDGLAVRPGVIYTATGKAAFGLPVGKYTIYAGRGFAYGIASASVTVESGKTVRPRLTIRREVPTPGLVACDTHVHTLTFSGHGDCSIDERMITLAGEGIELPIATDHNVHVDYEKPGDRNNVRKFFTPVIGNEVTTPVGHFCVFPVPLRAPAPDAQLRDWKAVFGSIAERTAAKVIVLNHARDIHMGYRPFDPKHHNAVTGENLDGWELKANAMEVINSGAMQTDDLRLYRDWFGLLNRGLAVAAVGSSDSHDVSRYIVGQARTYVRVKNDDPGRIDINEAVAAFQAGRVNVSLGLLTDITVNDKYGPGDLAPASDRVKVRVRVWGPSWTTAEAVELFANGRKIQEAKIADGKKPGLKWESTWDLPRFPYDVHLVAIATGPGVKALYWPIAKPYQPTSPQVLTRVIGSTGAVWIDGDGDGKRSSAHDYAARLMKEFDGDVPKIVPALAEYDEAVAAQAAGLLQARGVNIGSAEIRDSAQKAGPHVRRGFDTFFAAWRECQLARSKD